MPETGKKFSCYTIQVAGLCGHLQLTSRPLHHVRHYPPLLTRRVLSRQLPIGLSRSVRVVQDPCQLFLGSCAFFLKVPIYGPLTKASGGPVGLPNTLKILQRYPFSVIPHLQHVKSGYRRKDLSQFTYLQYLYILNILNDHQSNILRNYINIKK